MDNEVLASYTDISKAFDRVPRYGLLKKRSKLELEGLSWKVHPF